MMSSACGRCCTSRMTGRGCWSSRTVGWCRLRCPMTFFVSGNFLQCLHRLCRALFLVMFPDFFCGHLRETVAFWFAHTHRPHKNISESFIRGFCGELVLMLVCFRT